MWMTFLKKNPAIVFASCVILLVFLVSCSPRASAQLPSYGRTSETRKATTATHNFSLQIVDASGEPLDGTIVSYKILNRDNLGKEDTIKVSPDGLFSVSFEATADPKYRHVRSYRSTFEYTVSKEGYYSKSGNLSSFKEGYDSQDAKIVLIKPMDYLNPSFASSEPGRNVKEKILAFITAIRLKSLLHDADLKVYSINLSPFKDKMYLQFGFNTFNPYNSLKMNKYDIGNSLFDEVVRKVLSPMNENISDPKAFYGYDLSVTGYTKNSDDKYASGTAIEYRYIMPESLVRKYNDRIISGQKLLDGSVILMNDERIELKLQ
jgi:hypothetical protein